MKTTPKIFLLLAMAILFILACTFTAASVPVPTTTPIPPTVAAAPLYQQVLLTPTDLNESNQNPAYTITAQIPTLTGSDDPRAQAFNQLAAQVVQQAVDEFKANVSSMPPVSEVGGSGSFDVRYSLLSSSLEFISLKFDMDGYIQGAAHPYHLSHTLNFDLEKGQEISLGSLFLTGSDYLVTIANYSAMELQKRDIAFDVLSAQGAAPIPENYRNWNITPEGLLVTFEEYQVAAYAAGPQTVVVPYAELAALIDPQGPLAGFLP